MILRNVTLSNWRALEKFEMSLETGLNVLQGRNEAGKSSVVEAIDWALYRDISGTRIKSDEVRALIPARDPMARPSVEVELEFPDCRVTLLKVLAEDASKRECRLTLRRTGRADEHFDRTEAQKRLKALLSADGLGEEKGSVASGGLLVAHQGESSDFLSDGTAAIRSTLGIGSDGQLALTARLERTRSALETLRRREILQDLETSALEVARAGTDAATAREELKEARYQLEHFQNVTKQIENLREQLDELGNKLADLVPRQAAARTQLEEMGATLLAQNEADKVVLNAQSAEREAKVAYDAAKSRTDEIARLQHLQSETQRELDATEGAVEAATKALEEAQNRCDAAHQVQQAAGQEAETARHLAEAWRHYQAVYEAQAALRDEKKAFEGLQALGASLSEAQQRRDAVPKAPTFDVLRSWRNAFDQLQRLQGEAAQGVQVELDFLRPLAVSWSSDSGEEVTESATEEKLNFSASSEGVLNIEGVGQVRVRTGARGVQELHNEVMEARKALEELLKPWDVAAADMPQAIPVWEERRESYDSAENAWKEAAEALRREESRSGTLHQAEQRVAEREADFKAAKERCKEFEGVIELGGKGRREVRDAFDAAEQEAKEAESRANRARNEAATASQQLRQAEGEFHRIKARPDALQEAMASRALELARQENDGLTQDERSAQLTELNQSLVRARIALEDAQRIRREMGDGISQWKLSDARRVAEELSNEKENLEKALATLERDLFHACQQDANAEIERLTVLVEELEVKAARHEARLRGIALLDAIVQAERARLSRDLAGPLNQKLGPWLSQLRGKETSLAFDETGSRIDNILSRDGESTISLPFGEHSEGLKEQVAFALRLLLATRVASHLPSKRLPVVLDDPFTQSDASRLGGLGGVLEDAAQSLQILFVTCHGAPQVDGVDVNTIRLGEWDDGITVPVRSKSATKPKKVERAPAGATKTKVVESTLALF